MNVLSSTRYIKVRHKGLTRKSILLADIDNDFNRKKDSYKLPVYIPYNQTVDILYDDRVALSFQQGDLRGFIDQGFLEAWIIDNPNLNLVSYNSSVYLPQVTVEYGEKFVLIDSSGGPVTVELPPSDLNMGPITIKRSSTDTNIISVVPQNPDVIDGFSPMYAMLDSLDWVELWPDGEGGWWKTGEFNPGGGGGGTFIEEEFEISNPSQLIYTLSNVPNLNGINIYLNGIRIKSGLTRDFTILGANIILNPTTPLFVNDYLTAIYTV